MGIFSFLWRKKEEKTICKNKIEEEKQNKDDFQKKINKLNEQQKQLSDELHNKHIKAIKKFDINNIMSTDSHPLSSVELSFLKYINCIKLNKITELPIYWSLEYNIDYKYTISKFLNMNLLTISNSIDILSTLKMAELKEILEINNFPSSARKKSVLIERIIENIEITKLDELLKNKDKYFILTDEGSKIVETIKDSITKDIEFEDKCISFLENGDIENAYKLVCEFKIRTKNNTFMDWNYELKKGLNTAKLNRYHNILNLNFYHDKNIEKAFKLSYILSDMLGISNYSKLVKRLNNDNIDKSVLKDLMSKIDYESYKIKSNYEIRETNDDYDVAGYYQILSALDLSTCDICGSLDGKIFKNKDAKVGINYPPFHQGCRCTVVPYFDDEFDDGGTRIARNPITGKSEYVSNMNYTQWKKIIINKYGENVIDDLVNKYKK